MSAIKNYYWDAIMEQQHQSTPTPTQSERLSAEKAFKRSMSASMFVYNAIDHLPAKVFDFVVSRFGGGWFENLRKSRQQQT